MQTTTTAYNNAITAPVRTMKAKAELYNGSALVTTYTQSDSLIELEIQREGEDSKFFGFGICARLNFHLRDISRAISITTANTIIPSIGVVLPNSSTSYMTFPKFKVTEVNRNENTNELSITAYDLVYEAANHTVSELELTAPYSLKDFAEACAALLGTTVDGISGAEWLTEYPDGANFEGTESVRQALDMLAEVTQTIYYIGYDNILHFKRIGTTVNLAIGKDEYFTLKSGDNRRLQTIFHCTELGDNVSESTSLIGSTQYIRDNAFWELREDIDTLVHEALMRVGNKTINQFECKWRGNPALECGDMITLETKEGGTISSFLLSDTLSFDGGLTEKTTWKFDNNDNETDTNSTSLGDALRQTFARVDKANKQITLVASDVDDSKNDIAQLFIGTNKIESSVSALANKTSTQVSELQREVSAKMTDVDVTIAINSALTNGVDKVVTSSGYKFTADGLDITKSGSEMSTTINEDGMRVKQNNELVLTANNFGVDARNLHATTYTIFGNTSRFEDFNGRTTCFWIGEE